MDAIVAQYCLRSRIEPDATPARSWADKFRNDIPYERADAAPPLAGVARERAARPARAVEPALAGARERADGGVPRGEPARRRSTSRRATTTARCISRRRSIPLRSPTASSRCMRQYGLDGYDMDWENGLEAGPLKTLLSALRAAFDAAGAEDGERYGLTMATWQYVHSRLRHPGHGREPRQHQPHVLRRRASRSKRSSASTRTPRFPVAKDGRRRRAPRSGSSGPRRRRHARSGAVRSRTKAIYATQNGLAADDGVAARQRLRRRRDLDVPGRGVALGGDAASERADDRLEAEDGVRQRWVALFVVWRSQRRRAFARSRRCCAARRSRSLAPPLRAARAPAAPRRSRARWRRCSRRTRAASFFGRSAVQRAAARLEEVPAVGDDRVEGAVAAA